MQAAGHVRYDKVFAWQGDAEVRPHEVLPDTKVPLPGWGVTTGADLTHHLRSCVWNTANMIVA